MMQAEYAARFGMARNALWYWLRNNAQGGVYAEIQKQSRTA